MNRPLRIHQDERDHYGDRVYWYTVQSGANGATLLTSETYPSRRNAVRAARSFIAAITPAQVEFSYWTGRVGSMELRTELIR